MTSTVGAGRTCIIIGHVIQSCTNSVIFNRSCFGDPDHKSTTIAILLIPLLLLLISLHYCYCYSKSNCQQETTNFEVLHIMRKFPPLLAYQFFSNHCLCAGKAPQILQKLSVPISKQHPAHPRPISSRLLIGSCDPSSPKQV